MATAGCSIAPRAPRRRWPSSTSWSINRTPGWFAGLEHWRIFRTLLSETNAAGKLVADAYHAALAIEQGCEWLSADADFGRFRGLRWRHPLRR